MAPKLFVPKECADGETRVAITPDSVKRLLKAGFAVEVEPGAGESANIADSAYEQAGATLAKDVKAAWSGADVVVKINTPAQNPTLGGPASCARARSS
jgi:NAD(P) transhydrogenase subunit alpha